MHGSALGASYSLLRQVCPSRRWAPVVAPASLCHSPSAPAPLGCTPGVPPTSHPFFRQPFLRAHYVQDPLLDALRNAPAGWTYLACELWLVGEVRFYVRPCLNNVGSEVVTGQSQESVWGSQSQEGMGRLGGWGDGKGRAGPWNVSVSQRWFAAMFVSGRSRQSRGVMRWGRVTDAVSVTRVLDHRPFLSEPERPQFFMCSVHAVVLGV